MAEIVGIAGVPVNVLVLCQVLHAAGDLYGQVAHVAMVHNPKQ